MIKGFQSFLANAKSPYHVNEYIKNNIFNNELNKLEDNDNILGKTFIETRNNTSIILISIPNEIDIKDITFNIACAHNDSPTFKLKQNFLLRKNGYNLLNTEIYGGPILNTFMDRPFDVCGRILYRDNNKIKHINVSLDKAVCIIPNCSIHYYPDLNKGVKLNPQEELVPIISKENTDLLQQYCDKYKLNKEDILSYDLFLSLIDRGMTLGENDEFFTGPQLDDLSSVYPMLMSFKDQIKKNKKQINVCAIFNNEEIGSNTKEGASSTFLKEILSEVYYKLTNNYNGFDKAISKSYLLSIDNAHGFNPNYASKYDPTNYVNLNDGVVIKSAARGSYTSDGLSIAVIKKILEDKNIPYQLNSNRSDIPGGSTLGVKLFPNLSITSCDIGISQFAMHSAYETIGVNDMKYLKDLLDTFYTKKIKIDEEEIIIK